MTRKGDRWHLRTAAGSVLAGQVLQATNAQPPALAAHTEAARATVKLTVYELATPVLPPALRQTILPHDEAMSDTRNNLFACCIDDSGRIVTGGMAPLTRLGAEHWLPAPLARRLNRIFPQLRDALGDWRFEHVWSGQAALTPDFLPRLFEPAQGWLVPFTCNGRGVALSTALGLRLGRCLATGNTDAMPLATTAPTPIRLHALASLVPQLLLPLGMLADRRNGRVSAVDVRK